MTTTPETVETSAPNLSGRAARAVTEVLAPWVLVAGLPVTVALAEAPRPERLAWSAVNILACSLLPMATIKRAQRAGKVTSGHHVTDRAQRIAPLSIAVVSVVAGLVALHVGDAPAELVALAWAMFAGLVSALAITAALKFKISFHVAVAAAAVVVLVDVCGPWAAAGAVAAAAVAWSRVRLGDHTVAEVTAGAILGVAVSGGLFLALV